MGFQLGCKIDEISSTVSFCIFKKLYVFFTLEQGADLGRSRLVKNIGQ